VPGLDTVVAFYVTYPKHTMGLDSPGKTLIFARSARKRDTGKPLAPRRGEVFVVEVEVVSAMATNCRGGEPAERETEAVRLT
jgi:hypothetical protein